MIRWETERTVILTFTKTCAVIKQKAKSRARTLPISMITENVIFPFSTLFNFKNNMVWEEQSVCAWSAPGAAIHSEPGDITFVHKFINMTVNPEELICLAEHRSFFSLIADIKKRVTAVQWSVFMTWNFRIMWIMEGRFSHCSQWTRTVLMGRPSPSEIPLWKPSVSWGSTAACAWAADGSLLLCWAPSTDAK